MASKAAEWFEAGAKPRGLEWSGERIVVRAIAQRGNKMAVSLLMRGNAGPSWQRRAHLMARFTPQQFLDLCQWGIATFGDQEGA